MAAATAAPATGLAVEASRLAELVTTALHEYPGRDWTLGDLTYRNLLDEEIAALHMNPGDEVLILQRGDHVFEVVLRAEVRPLPAREPAGAVSA